MKYSKEEYVNIKEYSAFRSAPTHGMEFYQKIQQKEL